LHINGVTTSDTRFHRPRARSATDGAWRDDRAGSVDLTNADEARERAHELIAPLVIGRT
jgi:hypothetical protein